MKVSDVMTSKPLFCRLETNLGAATELLWNGNCGFLPVVGEGGRLVGTITDRDICIALGTRHQLPGQITVAEVAPNTPVSCGPDDDLRAALAIMRARKVHRLAVVNAKGELQGVLSMDDIFAQAPKLKTAGGVSPEELTLAMGEIISNQVRRAPAQKAA